MKKIYMHSLGCSKNLVDSENMLGFTDKKGIQGKILQIRLIIS